MAKIEGILSRYKATVAYLVILVLTVFALYTIQQDNADDLRQTQMEACERGNAVRATQNEIISAFKDVSIIVSATSENIELAQRFADRIETLKPQPAVDCDNL